MAISIFKFHILRSHTTISMRPLSNAVFSCRRFLELPLLLRPRPLHTLPHFLPILPHSHLPPLTPPPPLVRRRFHPPRSPMSAMNSSPASDGPSVSAADKTVKVVIKGRVQGVFYRNWTVDNARELGLKGWVRNRRDGAVEAVFSGSPDKVQEMEQRCRRGPPDAMVTGLQVSPCTDDPGTTFERKPTV